MASNNSGVQQQEQKFLAQGNSPYHCKECGISLNSAESLDVHLQYHKENLLKHWAVQAQSSHGNEETNNNNNTTTTKTSASIKRELISNTVAAADSSDSMQKNSVTPEINFGHPPTPQSYQSAASPYQNQDNTGFSPGFSNYPIKSERLSPGPQFQQSYANYPDPHQQQSFYNIEQQYNQDAFGQKPYRYHPYSQPYERQAPPAQVSSSSPAYPPQPTPSPSPKQCDKCGYVCESASQLIEHLNIAHPPTPAPHLSSYQPNQHFLFDQHPVIKQEDAPQSEILDLDSHKVVHNVYHDEEKRQDGGNPANPHSVTAMLNQWPPHQQQQSKMFQDQQNVFINSNEQRIYHQMPNQEFMGNNVTTTSQESLNNQSYRPFEHMPSPGNASVISSTQVPANPTPPAAGVQKSSNWKSNEARRPKTYNCTACNKWFTSSGHLKRHYNTTLHKNAVKSSGQPDPAVLPISAHHHPARESNSNKQDERPQSGSSGDDIRSGDDTNSMSQFERLNSMPGLVQQPPIGPYDRQPAPNIHHTPPLHSPMGHSPMVNLSNGSPNGEAGLSTSSLDSRGLLSTISATPQPPAPTHHGYNMAAPTHPHHMMSSAAHASMEDNQFQMYPNEFAPHVSQAMAINNPNITGDFFQIQSLVVDENQQPLPSFAQIQAHRFAGMVSCEIVNVGGQGPVTAPLTYFNTSISENRDILNENYKLTDISRTDTDSQDEYILGGSPDNNNHEDSSLMSMSPDNGVKVNILEDIKLRLKAQPKSPEKAHTKRDYEETTGSPLISSTVINKPCLHKCYDCDKVFNKACYLTQHNKTFHSGDKPFKCTRCGKRFSCEITYQEHSTKHAGDKPHKCELCPKQFNHKTDLRRHMCLHTGQKPYACDTCGKGFIRKDHMMKHCETHTRKTNARVAAIR